MLDIVHLMGDDVGSHRVKSSPRVRRGWIPTPLCRTYSSPGTEGKSAASGGLSGAARHAQRARGARYAGPAVAMIVAGRSRVAGAARPVPSGHLIRPVEVDDVGS